MRGWYFMYIQCYLYTVNILRLRCCGREKEKRNVKTLFNPRLGSANSFIHCVRDKCVPLDRLKDIQIEFFTGCFHLTLVYRAFCKCFNDAWTVPREHTKQENPSALHLNILCLVFRCIPFDTGMHPPWKIYGRILSRYVRDLYKNKVADSV